MFLRLHLRQDQALFHIKTLHPQIAHLICCLSRHGHAYGHIYEHVSTVRKNCKRYLRDFHLSNIYSIFSYRCSKILHKLDVCSGLVQGICRCIPTYFPVCIEYTHFLISCDLTCCKLALPRDCLQKKLLAQRLLARFFSCVDWLRNKEQFTQNA